MRIITTNNRRRVVSAAVVRLIVMTGLAATALADMRWVDDTATGKTTLVDGDRPVLTYNFQTVPVPPGATGRYAVARGDYIHPLYGWGGEVLTEDYPQGHPHHRGLYWAWPEVTWKGEMRDLHALQGVFARPVRIPRADVTKGCAVLETVNVWDWAGAGPIVREEMTLSVSSVTDRMRIIDFEFRFHALVDAVTLARRKRQGYGGFNLRMSSREDQKILRNTDPADISPRAAWAFLSGIPPRGTNTVTLLILQHAANPEYPGDWVAFDQLNWLQPTFPSCGTAFALGKGKPLVLRYRLVVTEGVCDPAWARAAWVEYNDNHEKRGGAL